MLSEVQRSLNICSKLQKDFSMRYARLAGELDLVEMTVVTKLEIKNRIKHMA